MFAKLNRQRRPEPTIKVLFRAGGDRCANTVKLPVSKSASLKSRDAMQAGALRNRIWLCVCAFALVFGGLSFRLANLSLAGPEAVRAVPIQASAPKGESLRPAILDRNGSRLAMNQPVTGAAVKTRNVWDVEVTAQSLASVFPDKDPVRLAKRLKENSYVLLSSDLSQSEEDGLLQLGLPGLEFFETVKRAYPKGSLAAHTVGYTIAGRGGVAGLEKYIDADEKTEAVVSSIDIRVQQILEQELLATLEEFAAKAAWGVIMDAHTGEVIALANLPTFNPNEPNRAPVSNWRNRAMYDVYELGSAFKVLTAAMALEGRISDLEQSYDVRHPIMVSGKKISDYKPKGGFMTLTEIIQYSSNIGMAQIALDMGALKQRAYLKRLGLINRLPTELPENRDPILPASWGPVETATISYGHGIAVTPLQLTAAIAAVVNGGIYVAPTFERTDEPIASERVFSEATSARMRLILRRVVTDGTARNAEAPGYYVIGKTATADKPSPFGGYMKDARLSSFVGAFPGYDPRYVMLVSFDEPLPTEKTYGYATAGVVAAPPFSRIVNRLGPVLGLPTANDNLAFAKFMSHLKDSPKIQLAENTHNPVVHYKVSEEDRIADLIAGMGP